jgi:hypothetical protein
MESASYLREKAEQCRRLAGCILGGNDPTGRAMNALAVEFDAAASAIEARTDAAESDGYGDDVPPDAPF